MTTRSLVGAYGVALLIPVVLWAISEPLLAAGLAALVGGAYAVGRVGLRVVRRRHRVRTGTSAEAGSPRNRTAEPDP